MNKSNEKQAIENRNKIINKSPKERYVCYNDVIGKGSYKIVYRGYDTFTGIEVAWNLIHFDVLDETEQNLIIDEVKLLEKLSSQNDYIIQFYNAWIDKQCGDLVVITELAMSGTLKEYIRKINNVKLRVVKRWCKQILDGISFLHRQNIVHRDLKCTNIFINSNTGNVIIGDLGLAKRIRTNLHSVIGTPQYMAPEMFEGGYTEKVDIYAFGMCLIEIITRKIPYSECPGVGSVYKKISEGKYPEQLDLIKSVEICSIIKRCIKFNPDERPSAKDLLQDPFFQCIKDSDNDDTMELCGQSTCGGTITTGPVSCVGLSGNITDDTLPNHQIPQPSNPINVTEFKKCKSCEELQPTVIQSQCECAESAFAINSYEQADKIDPIEQYISTNSTIKLDKHNTSIIRSLNDRESDLSESESVN